MTILIIDDDPDMLVIAGIALREAGHAVLEATTGAEAFEVVAGERPDVILLDRLLNGTDGVVIHRALAADPRVSDVPVIYFSGMSSWIDPVPEELAVQGRIEKPFDPSTLSDQIRSILEAGSGD